MAYQDYNDLMDMTEELISGMVMAIHGTYKIKFQPMGQEEVELDFQPPWPRYSMCDTIEKRARENKGWENFKIPKTFDETTVKVLITI